MCCKGKKCAAKCKLQRERKGKGKRDVTLLRLELYRMYICMYVCMYVFVQIPVPVRATHSQHVM